MKTNTRFFPIEDFYFFLIMSGACMLSKYHMWGIGFVAFTYALFVTRRSILHLPPKTLFAAFFLAVLIASWWPITSYFANDGDIIGKAKLNTPLHSNLATGYQKVAELNLSDYNGSNNISYHFH
jgi:hypothetical protein